LTEEGSTFRPVNIFTLRARRTKAENPLKP